MIKIILTIILCLLPIFAQAENLYVRPVNDCSGAPCNSANGSDWDNAFNGFSDILWGAGAGSVSAGDTLYVSGGSVSATYAERLSIGTSGTEELPITITVGADVNHNGTVKITGTAGLYYGINIPSKNWITIDGQSNNDGQRHIEIYQNAACAATNNCVNTGIYISGTSVGAKLKYIYLHDVGLVNNDYTTAIKYGLTNSTYATGHEISYCYIEKTIDGINVGLSGGIKPTAYGGVKIHHNYIKAYDDDIQTTVSTDIYNNTLTRDDWSISGYGHPDGIQSYGSYVRIYNNLFTGFLDYASGNSAVYWEPDGGENMDNNEHEPCCFQVYNNVFSETGTASTSIGAISLGIGDTRFISVSDVQILNNTFNGAYSNTLVLALGGNSLSTKTSGTLTVGSIYTITTYNSDDDFTNVGAASNANGVKFTATGTTPTKWTNSSLISYGTILDKSQVTNINILGNLFYNSIMSGKYMMALARPVYVTTPADYGSYGSGASIVVDYNSYYSSVNTLVSYLESEYSYANFLSTSGCQAGGVTADPKVNVDLTLQSISPCINAFPTANAPTSIFTTDYIGTTRPQGSAWDIGAYEDPAPTITSFIVDPSGSFITMAGNEILIATISTGLTLTSDGGAVTLTYASGSGTTGLVYSTSRTILSTETITYDYTQPGNGIEDASGNDLASIAGGAVTNSSTQSGAVTGQTTHGVTGSTVFSGAGSTTWN